MSRPQDKEWLNKQCIWKIMAMIIAGQWPVMDNSIEKEEIKCDGEECAQFSHASGRKRCGMRNI